MLNTRPNREAIIEMTRLGGKGFRYQETYRVPGQYSEINSSVAALRAAGWLIRTVSWTRSNHGRKAAFVALMACPRPEIRQSTTKAS